jgi:hypothetical protein
MLSPSGAGCAFVAEPAEFYSFLLEGAIVKRAGCTHSKLAFASSASAFGFSVVGWAESAGEAANSDFNVTYLHLFCFPRVYSFWFFVNFSFLLLTQNNVFAEIVGGRAFWS